MVVNVAEMAPVPPPGVIVIVFVSVATTVADPVVFVPFCVAVAV